MTEDMNDDEKFSDDPEEQLKIENDILKLKLQAELGADFTVEEELSPDIENMFLKNVLELEHQFANASFKTIFEILGEPDVAKVEELNEEKLPEALGHLEELMEEKGIVVDYGDEYDDRIKYQFITEELFYKESTLINIPGMTTHFIYEEFHPNHRLDIKSKAEGFFNNWEDLSFHESDIELAAAFRLADGSKVPKAEVIQKLIWIFESYVRIDDFAPAIDDITFVVQEDETGEAEVNGSVGYTVVLENGETRNFQGDFTFQLQYRGYWSIYCFQWPGFNW